VNVFETMDPICKGKERSCGSQDLTSVSQNRVSVIFEPSRLIRKNWGQMKNSPGFLENTPYSIWVQCLPETLKDVIFLNNYFLLVLYNEG